MSSFAYHVCLRDDTSRKTAGGAASCSGDGWPDVTAIDRFVNKTFTVRKSRAGRLTFVDKADREVLVYVAVDPLHTQLGRAAHYMYARQQQEEAAWRLQLDQLLTEMPAKEAVRRLSNPGPT
jgi:hypothetical protein